MRREISLTRHQVGFDNFIFTFPHGERLQIKSFPSHHQGEQACALKHQSQKSITKHDHALGTHPASCGCSPINQHLPPELFLLQRHHILLGVTILSHHSMPCLCLPKWFLICITQGGDSALGHSQVKMMRDIISCLIREAGGKGVSITGNLIRKQTQEQS